MTHGSGGFFIHGGSAAGSAGCIDLAHAMGGFVDRLTAMIGPSPNCFVQDTVRY